MKKSLNVGLWGIMLKAITGSKKILQRKNSLLNAARRKNNVRKF